MGNHHPNRNWRKRWVVDLDTKVARHATGLIVKFTANSDGGWTGAAPNAVEWFAVDPMGRAQIVARLLREAADIYQEALHK